MKQNRWSVYHPKSMTVIVEKNRKPKAKNRNVPPKHYVIILWSNKREKIRRKINTNNTKTTNKSTPAQTRSLLPAHDFQTPFLPPPWFQWNQLKRKTSVIFFFHHFTLNYQTKNNNNNNKKKQCCQVLEHYQQNFRKQEQQSAADD